MRRTRSPRPNVTAKVRAHHSFVAAPRAIMATVTEPDHRLADPLVAARERFDRRGPAPLSPSFAVAGGRAPGAGP